MSSTYWIVCAIFMLGILASTWVAWNAGQNKAANDQRHEIRRLNGSIRTLDALLEEEMHRSRFYRNAMRDMQRELQGQVKA